MLERRYNKTYKSHKEAKVTIAKMLHDINDNSKV